MSNARRKSSRLSREEWLSKALDVLSEDPGHLRIDEVASALGVSKGSFYWHFENRSDFVHALAEYWRDRYTVVVAAENSNVQMSAEDRLYMHMQQIFEHKIGRYDLAVRAWARHEASIRPVISEVDKVRLETLKDIFLDMGFNDAEASMRARVFAVYGSLEDALSVQLSRKEAREQLESRHTFFTRR